MIRDAGTDDILHAQVPPDRLTIRRLLLLTAGVAVALGAFCPPPNWDAESWLGIGHSILIGLALPAPLFAMPRRHVPGVGGLFALMAGLGSLTMLPPAYAMRFYQAQRMGGSPFLCLYYCLPLMSLWFILAALMSGQLHGLFRRDTAWVERYGALLALLWSPLGAWHLICFYIEAFHP